MLVETSGTRLGCHLKLSVFNGFLIAMDVTVLCPRVSTAHYLMYMDHAILITIQIDFFRLGEPDLAEDFSGRVGKRIHR